MCVMTLYYVIIISNLSKKIKLQKTFSLTADKSAYHHLSMLCRRACTSPAFCSLIAYSWLDLAVCDTQRPVVSKERNESTRSRSQISQEWAERHKFSPTDCCPRHVLPIEHMNNEHSHHRPLCQGQGLLQWNATGERRHHSLSGRRPLAVSRMKTLLVSNGLTLTVIFRQAQQLFDAQEFMGSNKYYSCWNSKMENESRVRLVMVTVDIRYCFWVSSCQTCHSIIHHVTFGTHYTGGNVKVHVY